jgi:short-subunit dehydrogenase
MSEIFAQHGIDLVLVARSIEVLQNMKKNLEKKYQIEAFILEKDLSLEASAHEVYAYTQSHNIRIDYLINNAGFGEY